MNTSAGPAESAAIESAPLLTRSSLPNAAWHVLHTMSRQEKTLSRDLQAMNVAHYLPLVRQVRYYGRHKTVVEEPLFPGYVFLLGSLDEAYVADRTRRVANIIKVTDQNRIEWELRNLQLALGRNAPLNAFPHLRKGLRVHIRSGPFQGIEGLIEDRARNDRVLLQVDVLGRAVGLEVDGCLLDVID
jgi:transcription antitermination factor NusG